MAKEYKNIQDMKSVKEIMKNKTDKMNQDIEILNQKMENLIEHIQKGR